MSKNRIVFDGLDELRAELRNLPTTLAGEATGIVMEAAIQTKDTIDAVYEQHRHKGNLANGLTLNVENIGPHGTAAVVRSRAPHAWLFEKGSRARHWATGKSTGTMWGKTGPTWIVIKTAIRNRRIMHEKLRALLQRTGLTVTGTIE